MARERMVTRTVELTVCEVMCMNIVTAEVSVRRFEVGGGITNQKDLLKYIQKHNETTTFKCVAITSTEAKEVLYGMPESRFIELAQIMPPRGTKGAEG